MVKSTTVEHTAAALEFQRGQLQTNIDKSVSDMAQSEDFLASLGRTILSNRDLTNGIRQALFAALQGYLPGILTQ